ncbi:hypothetical protein FWC31_02075 [Candidatus Saccharibacteria bacterium]|nr:hypothetical protein [Candidatus Saccharibacteria bacterium]
MVGIIYNMTYLCPHGCSICCVDSVKIKENGENIEIYTNALSNKTVFARNSKPLYVQAADYLHSLGMELSFNEKLKLFDNLDIKNLEMQISGGDALLLDDNMNFLKMLSEKIGKRNLSLVTTSKGIRKEDIQEISSYISQYNCAYDNPYKNKNLNYRSDGYVSENLHIAKEFLKSGISVQAECVLTRDNMRPELLNDLYLSLHNEGINNLLLMRIIPFIGRNTDQENVPTNLEYRSSINALRELEQKYTYPKINLICSLKYLYPDELTENPCQMSKNVMGLTPSGKLLLSPYAFGIGNKPLDEYFEIGSLVDNKLSRLLENPIRQEIIKRHGENIGHCKIQSYLYSNKPNFIDRILDTTDPLYKL